MGTSEYYILLVVVVVLFIVGIGIGLLTLNKLRRQKQKLIGDLQRSPRHDADRAFNRIAMARREVDVLARQGVDVSRAKELIAQAQAASDLRHFDRAYELAHSAHESLVRARQGGPLASAAAAPAAAAPPRPTSRLASVPVSSGSNASGTSATVGGSAPTPTSLPRNRLESQFEMRLLDSDLETARLARPDAPATLAAVDFQSKAKSAFDAGQYTEAFRFALKGRRGLGGGVETVAPNPGSRTAETAPVAVDLEQEAESAASASRCPDCGYPTRSDDVYCRGCGAPRATLACPKCASPRTPSDTFCGRCGTSFS